MLKKFMCSLLVLAFSCSLFGCVNLRPYQKQEYKQLEYRLQAVGLEPLEEKDPGVAAALNILPGFGNAYLDQWGPFIGNLLLWPISIIWGIPQAYRDAGIMNKQETLYFYQFGPGKQRLEELERDKGITSDKLEEYKLKAMEEIQEEEAEKKEAPVEKREPKKNFGP